MTRVHEDRKGRGKVEGKSQGLKISNFHDVKLELSRPESLVVIVTK